MGGGGCSPNDNLETWQNYCCKFLTSYFSLNDILVALKHCKTVRDVIGRAKRAPHWDVQSRFCVIYICIREYGSTLYVGLALAVSPTNTNFRLTFLLTRLQEALYEDLAV